MACASSTGSPSASSLLRLVGFWTRSPGLGPAEAQQQQRHGRAGSGGRGREPATLFPPYLPLTTSCPGGTCSLGLWSEGQMDRGSRQLSPWPPPLRGCWAWICWSRPMQAFLSCSMSLLNLIKCSGSSGVLDGWDRVGDGGWGFLKWPHHPHPPALHPS